MTVVELVDCEQKSSKVQIHHKQALESHDQLFRQPIKWDLKKNNGILSFFYKDLQHMS